MNLRIASDGEPAREVGAWSRDKLYYIERYLNAFCIAMRKKKWQRLVYADFLSGPGLCIEKDTNEEFEGSPLLALRRSEFSRLFFNDNDRDASAALARRAEKRASVR